MAKKTRPPFRSLLCPDPQRSLVFMTDVLSQPKGDQTLHFDKYIHYQCARALPMAEDDDIVVLAASVDQPYYRWLRSVGFGPGRVVSFDQDTPQMLTALLRADRSKLMKDLPEGSNPLLVPYYCSRRDIECAAELGLEILGCDESITLKYFNKVSFKNECKALGIQMVDGSHHDIDPHAPMNEEEMASMVEQLLTNYNRVLIRGAEDSGTRSFFTADSPDIQPVYAKLVENRDRSVLIEPLLHVISSPNAQWCIDSTGDIRFVGITAQQFQGFRWSGNQSGQYYSNRVYDYIRLTSKKVVEAMADHGYRGIIGIDYIVCEEGIFPIENNARMTGSSFAIAVTDKAKARNQNIVCWKFFKAQTNPCTFDELQALLTPLLYDGERTNSVFPMMTDLLPHNGTFIMHLLAEDMYHIDYLQESLTLMGITRA